MSHQSRNKLLEIIGRDGQAFRKAYSQEHWKGELCGKVTMVSNETPNFNDAVLPSRFIKLRFQIVQEGLPTFDPHLKDTTLPRELPGIAVRCLAAYRRLKARNGFVQPASGQELERALARARDPLRAMVEECLEVSEVRDEWVIKEDAFEACKAWLLEKGPADLARYLRKEEMGGHIARVFEHLRGRKPDIQGTGGKRFWIRLRLSAEGRRLGGWEDDAGFRSPES